MDLDDAERLLIDMHAQELERHWACRALRASKDNQGAVLLSALAHTYDNAMPVLMRVAFPGFTSITPPFLTSCGRIEKHGGISADVMWEPFRKPERVVVYESETALRDDFRRLADRLKLSDADRIELFKVVQRWVTADLRLDPTMNPADPDAKHLVH